MTALDRTRRELTHRFPVVLPSGEAVLFTLATGDTPTYDDASIAILSLASGEYRVLIEGGTGPRYSPTGHIVYTRSASLLAVPFDVTTLKVTGAPVTVLESVDSSPYGGESAFDVAPDGSLLYAVGGRLRGKNRVVWVDRDGSSEALLEDPGPYSYPRLSPDGTRLALGLDGAATAVGLFDLARGTLSRVAQGYHNVDPLWTPDGRRVSFRSNRDGPYNIYWQVVDGGGSAERLTTSDSVQRPRSWSPDGKVLAFDQLGTDTGWDLWTLSLDAARNPRPEPFLETEADERFAMFSPDGGWLAYQSNESGQYEIYVRSFPSPGSKRLVSAGGGTNPRWNPNGRELFDRRGEEVIAVAVAMGSDLELGRPRVLFERAGDYDVAPNGERFVMIEKGASTAPAQLILVRNWAEELMRLVPTEK